MLFLKVAAFLDPVVHRKMDVLDIKNAETIIISNHKKKSAIQSKANTQPSQKIKITNSTISPNQPAQSLSSTQNIFTDKSLKKSNITQYKAKENKTENKKLLSLSKFCSTCNKNEQDKK